MSKQTIRAAQAGWTEFTSRMPAPDRHSVNEELERRGLPGISERMYRHYRALVRHGYDRYVPINELDMNVKAQRLQRAS